MLSKSVSRRVSKISKESLWEKIDNLVEQYKPVNLSKVCVSMVYDVCESLFIVFYLLKKGFPNWKPPSFITNAAVRGMIDLDLNQYTRFNGYPPLTEELSKYIFLFVYF